MSKQVVLDGLLLDDAVSLSWVEVCQVYQVDEHVLEEMLAYGLLSNLTTSAKRAHYDFSMLNRIQKALRLQHDLELNVPGSVLVLELLDHVDTLQAQLRMLSHHVLDENPTDLK